LPQPSPSHDATTIYPNATFSARRSKGGGVNLIAKIAQSDIQLSVGRDCTTSRIAIDGGCNLATGGTILLWQITTRV
jgi:hypothetical protein